LRPKGITLGDIEWLSLST